MRHAEKEKKCLAPSGGFPCLGRMADTPQIDMDRLAHLARIALTEEEKVRYAAQLGDILGYFEKLQEVDVEGIEPTAHGIPSGNVLRPDEPRAAFTPEEALANAPAQRENQVVVPKVVEDA